MGQRGPKKTPTKVLELRGSWLAKHRKPHEPAVQAGIPVRPAYLDEEERQVWKTLVTRLHKAGLLATIDGEMLGRYCVLRSRWLKALEWVRQHGDSYPIRDQAGHLVTFRVYPQTRQLTALHESLCRIEASFGMSPSARAALGALHGLEAQAHKDATKESETPSGPRRFLQLG
jgi:P27 family predicted phage terminase small subunit